MTIEDLYREVMGELESRAEPWVESEKSRWHKEPGYRSHGVGTQEQKALVKRYLPLFKELDLEDRLELARIFYSSGFSEQANFGNTLLELSVGELTPSRFDFLDEVADYLNNWASTDGFCIRVLQPILRKYPTETLTMLRGWNRSGNMWKRRASVVSFTRKIGASGEFTDEALELCDNLIWDDEDLVQKGVGWALKDCIRGDRKRVLEYVKNLRSRGASSTITLYAIRGLKGEERKEVLKIKPS